MPILIAGGVAELFTVVALLLLVYAATTLLVKPLVILLGAVPVVGSQIADALRKGAQMISDWALSWAKTSSDVLVSLVNAPVKWLGDVWRELIATFNGIVANINWLLGLIMAAGAVATVLAVRLGQVTLSLTSQLVALAASVWGTAVAAARAVIAPIEHSLRTLIAATAAAAAVAAANARTFAQGLVNAAQALAAGQLAKAVATLLATMHAIAATDAQAIQGVKADVDKLGALVNPLAAAGLLTLVPALVRELDMLRKECIDPTCSVITPQLPTLNALFDISTLLIVGGLVGEAVADPEGAARTTAGAVSTVERGAAELVGAFAGIRV